jgi:phosphate starvation-inducible protein PhoH
VRHRLVKQIIRAYDKEHEREEAYEKKQEEERKQRREERINAMKQAE